LRSNGRPLLHDFLRFVKTSPKVISKLGQTRGPPSHSWCCPGNTLIIFDWDDTLLCTTALKAKECSLTRADLLALQEQLLSLFKVANCLGKVSIVTCSAPGWVEMSAKKWLPALLPSLEQIPIIYAKEKYSRSFPGDSLQWKLQSFRELYDPVARTARNVVVIGDSQDEMLAAKFLGEMNPGILVKRVHFEAKSLLPELMYKLEMLGDALKGLAEAHRSQKIEINSEQAI